MDIYTVNSNDLSTLIKQQNLLNSKKLIKPKNNNLSINRKLISNLCFHESLAIVNEKEEEIGEFNGKIRVSNSNTSITSIIINLNSTNISECGEKIGMNLVTNTTINFHSYEEKWSQWCSVNTEIKSKTLLISKKNNEPIKIWTELLNGELTDQTNKNNLKYSKNLLTEGMNYAFLRYLAIIGFQGSIENKTAITINGKLCKTIYKCTLKKKYEINKLCIPVIIIERIIQEKKSFKNPIIQNTSVLTRSGYILKNFWSIIKSKELIIRKSMRITNDGRVINDTILYLKNDNWNQDIRFKSMYLDKYSIMKLKYNNYIKNNNAVKDMVIDYLKEILLTKPDDVLQFSINYFEKFK